MNIWKIIIWCFAGLAFAACLLEFFIPANPDRQTLSEELFLQSQAMQTSLVGETGRGWRRAIAEANSGRADELIAKLEEALFDGNYNAALEAAGLVKNAGLADRLYVMIADRAVEACQSLPYAALAARNMQPSQARKLLAERIGARQQICGQGARK